MFRTAWVILAMILLVGCTPQPSLDEQVGRLLAELGTDAPVSILVDGDLVAVESTRSVASVTPAREITVESIPRPNPALTGRPIADFDLEELGSRLKEITCTDDLRPAVRVDSLVGGALLLKEGCRNFRQFDVHTTLLDGKELTPLDGWSAETLDAALEDLASAIGPQVGEVSLRPAALSQVFGADEVSATLVVSEGCIPEVVRFGTHDDTHGTGHLDSFCHQKADATPPRPIPLGSLNGAQLMDAMDRLSAAMTAHPDFDADKPMQVRVEWREDELVLSTLGAVDPEIGRDLRVPLRKS